MKKKSMMVEEGPRENDSFEPKFIIWIKLYLIKVASTQRINERAPRRPVLLKTIRKSRDVGHADIDARHIIMWSKRVPGGDSFCFCCKVAMGAKLCRFGVETRVLLLQVKV